MRLRKAEPDEFEAIRSFYWDLIDRLRDRSSTVGWKKGIYPADEFLSESLRNGALYVFDREHDYIASVILNSAWNEGYEGLPWSLDCARRDILVPHALAVRPDLQGRGIGKAVVDEILRIAREQGKKTVRLDLLKGNLAAERLYTGAGFRYVQTKTMFYEDTGWTDFMMYELLL